ncbi:MAG TPA: DinB family protein [Thermoanaerobaculia bacterium]|nr:DinB family protein [Thermoanaerobaculia bacterium]
MSANLESARDLLAHMQWADAEIWRAIHATPNATEDERLMKLVMHLHAVQRAFLNMWTNVATEPEKLYAKRDAATLLEWARTYYAEAEVFVTGGESRLGETVHMPWLAGYEKQLGRSLQSPTLAETLLQVPMHSAYHRGQINTRIRELGGEPPLVDFIAWIWYGRAAPQWSDGVSAASPREQG